MTKKVTNTATAERKAITLEDLKATLSLNSPEHAFLERVEQGLAVPHVMKAECAAKTALLIGRDLVIELENKCRMAVPLERILRQGTNPDEISFALVSMTGGSLCLPEAGVDVLVRDLVKLATGI